MRFRDSCSTEKLFKWQYIAFFRAYLDTIKKALDTITVGLGFSISNFLINKMYQANKLSAKKVPSWANPALFLLCRLWK